MVNLKQSTGQNLESTIALGIYKAQHEFIKEAIEELRSSCKNPPGILEIQERTTKALKGSGLSELVIKARREEA